MQFQSFLADSEFMTPDGENVGKTVGKLDLVFRPRGAIRAQLATYSTSHTLQGQEIDKNYWEKKLEER